MVAAGCLCRLPSFIPKAQWMWTPVNAQDHFSLHANLVSECRLDKLGFMKKEYLSTFGSFSASILDKFS